MKISKLIAAIIPIVSLLSCSGHSKPTPINSFNVELNSRSLVIDKTSVPNNEDFNAKISVRNVLSSTLTLPRTINSVVVGNQELSSNFYIYDNTDGSFYIPKTYINGDIVITAEGYLIKPEYFDATIISDSLYLEYDWAIKNRAYDTHIYPISGKYILPDNLTSIKIDGIPLSASQYTYDKDTAKLHIDSNLVIGKIEITAEGVIKEKFISINNKNDMFEMNETAYQLQISCQNINEDDLKYESSNESVATIVDGNIGFVGIGEATIKVSSITYPEVSDSFTLRVTSTIVTGTIVDKDTLEFISDVIVSANGRTEKIISLKSFKFPLDEDEGTIYFEKRNYITQAIKISPATAKNVNVKLENIHNYHYVTITGNVKDIATASPLSNINVSITTDKVHTSTTDDQGNYVFNSIPCGSKVVIETFDSEHQSAMVEVDTPENVAEIKQDLTLEGFQNWVRFYVKNHDSKVKCDTIYGKVFHSVINEVCGLRFILKSNFANAFAGDNQLNFYLDRGEYTNHDPILSSHKDKKDFDISFKCNDLNTFTVNRHGATTVGYTGKPVVNIDSDKTNLEFFIPNSFIDYYFDVSETLGFACGYNNDLFDYYDTNCWEFGHPVKQWNKHSFARLFPDNKVMSGSHNTRDEIEGLSFDNVELSKFNCTGVLGEIGLMHVGGYEVKVAKSKDNSNGIYILTKSTYPTEYTQYFMSYKYERHIFIDVNASSYSPNSPNSEVKHFLNEGNQYIASYTVASSTKPFENKTTYTELYNEGLRYYSCGPEFILYVPFSKLGVNRDATLGFMFNLHQAPDIEPYFWKNWKYPEQNPTGYSELPNFEHRRSYIHLNKDLEIVHYSN